VSARRLHSIEHFGVARRYWWNHDFLRLMSTRWRLDRVTRVLDVGCGIGHWGAVLRTCLPADCEMVGVDSEAEWVKAASEVVKSSGRAGRCQFQVASAEALPFPDESFDMVTCQTLLMHVRDPLPVLREMRRVLQPGGLLAIVEPNNLVQSLMATSVNALDEVDARLRRVRFQLMCEKGKAALGEGLFSIGDLVPGLVAELGFREIQVFQSDKTLPYFPPYETVEQAALVRDYFGESSSADTWLLPKADARRYFAAAGGTSDDFDACWRRVESDNLREREALSNRKLHRAGGRVMYLTSGRK
jgi:SAM-dependent methyltransferase